MTQPSTTPPPADLEAVKRKQEATWASGVYSAVGALIPIISEASATPPTCAPGRACRERRT